MIDDYKPDYAITTLKKLCKPEFKEFADKQEAEKFFRLYTN